MLEASDRAWLRKLLLRAVECSLASSLALPACGDALDARTHAGMRPVGSAGIAGSGGVAPPASAPGVAVVPEAACVDDQWLLVPHFTLAHDVDYLADRLATLAVVSERGVRCGTASDPAACGAELTVPIAGVRHLVTTEGDVVQRWNILDARTLLAPIDVPEEALWFAAADNLDPGCTAKVFEQPQDAGGGYIVVRASGGQVRVTRDGVVSGTADPAGPPPLPFCCEGRRPEGLRSQHRPATRSSLGEHFAAMAHMEAASVPAFAAIATELSCHGAPASLVRAARIAMRDEIRHACIAASLARRFGATATPALVTPMPPRTLEAFALDNAVEGCVNETYAAARMHHQAARAQTPDIRRALASIAADESRHAALSSEIARWVVPKLSRATHARMHDAQEQAVAALEAHVEAPWPISM